MRRGYKKECSTGSKDADLLLFSSGWNHQEVGCFGFLSWHKEAIEQRLLHSQGPSDLRHRRMSWNTSGVLGGSGFVEVQLPEEENPLPLE